MKWHRTNARRFLALAFLTSLVAVQLFTTAVAAKGAASSFEFAVKFSELELAAGEGGTARLRMEGYSNAADAGLPALPARVLNLAVPPGRRASSVEAVSCRWEKVPGAQVVEWSQPPVALDGRQPAARVLADQSVYGSASASLPGPALLKSTGMMRGYSVAGVAVTPVRFRPDSGALEVCRDMVIRVSTVSDAACSPNGPPRAFPGGLESEVIDNFAQSQAWYGVSAAKDVRRASGVGDAVDYLVITGEELASSVDELKAYRESQGLTVSVVTTEHIYASYAGPDNAAKIRNFLVDVHDDWGVDYVLLVGLYTTVPFRLAYTSDTGQGWWYEYAPTDHYYSDLSGNWDLDGDGIYGDTEPGGVDCYPR